MKKFLLLLIIASILFTTGCFDYGDMNKLFFSTLAVYDEKKEGEVTLYSENFKAYRGGGEQSGVEKKVLFNGKGKTIFDAFSDLSRSTGYPIEYSQSKALVFTERSAKRGINTFIDATIRHQKANLKRFIFVYDGDPNKLLRTKMTDEIFIGLFLENLMLTQGELANVVRLRTDDLAYRRTNGSGVYVVPMIKTFYEPVRDRIEISKAAVFQNDRMVGKLSNDEVVAYNFLIEDADRGSIVANNPEHKDKYISMTILKNRLKHSIKLHKGKIHAKKEIHLKVSIQGVQNTIHLSKDIREKIERNAEEKIKKDCVDIFTKYKKKNVDILNIQSEFEREYPHENAKDVLKRTDFDVDVYVFIEGSQNTMDFVN